MRTPPIQLSKKEIQILGRLCASQKPEVARELLSIYDTKPLERDHSRIGFFFSLFCQIQQINPDDYRGSVFKSYKVDMRRLFVAAMVRMYIPHLYNAPAGSIRLDYGFVQSLSAELLQKKSNVANMIREVVVREKAYDEFRKSVDLITSQLIETYGYAAK